MRLLVLDTTHGGETLSTALAEEGHIVDCVDVYYERDGIPPETAQRRSYSACIAPVHLDPAYLLLHLGLPVITHHQAAGLLLGSDLPHPFIEITGERGKTTTAYALAHLMAGAGILHTSSGDIRYPEKTLLGRYSITPANIIRPVQEARRLDGWCIAESSLGVSGRGDLGILTSPGDYRIAAGRRSALEAKLRHLSTCRQLLLPEGICVDHPDAHTVGEITSSEGTTISYSYDGIEGSFDHPLLMLEGYRLPLLTATAAGCLLGIDPVLLRSFEALPGRMKTRYENGCLIVDASNSGTTKDTTIEAARYARQIERGADLHLIIGQDAHAVCENFADDDIIAAISAIEPGDLTIVTLDEPSELLSRYPAGRRAASLEAAMQTTEKRADTIILLAVKTWR
ncbi:hypothetical protein RJ53_07855 [Methanocalculus chunghsingensis]|uniref:Coenzyme F430 synthase n=2 Tax=Methanocalculus chunghsingensis TaxID=156457 RepID=A0A8J7WAP5_9EURY|nr:hypothetical protein [Methanocalculus chunghsingensis]